MATAADSVTEMATEVEAALEDRELSSWERILDELDRHQALIKGSLYSTLFIAFLYLKTSLSEYKRKHFKSRKASLASLWLWTTRVGVMSPSRDCFQLQKGVRCMSDRFLQSMASNRCVYLVTEGHIHVQHIPLFRVVLPLIPQKAFFANRLVQDCIRLQLDRVDLIAGQLPAIRDCFEGEEQEGHPRYGRVRGARKPPEDIHDKTAADVLRTLLVGRKVEFTPVEAGLGVIRANVRMRTLWWVDDIAEYLVARGLATTNHSSFSPQRALNNTSFIRSWESQRAYNRLMDLEKSAKAQRVGMWSNPQRQQQRLRKLYA
ncbi:hypothetical protein Emag_003043 [Eimeria magna]